MMLLRSLLLALFTTLTLASRAQPKAVEFTAREWHENDGLPTEEIDGLAIDEEGYLWTAGAGKFARFDGASFEVSKLPVGLDLTGITVLKKPESKSGAHFIAPVNQDASEGGPAQTSSAGFYRYADGQFSFEPEPQLAGKSVRTVFSQHDGTVWLGCDDGTLLRKHGNGSRVFVFPEAVSRKRPPAFATDSAGDVWTLVGEHIARFQKEEFTPVPLSVPATALRLVSSRNGGPWLLTHDAAYKWNGQTFAPVAPLVESAGAHFVQSALEDQYGALWFGTRSQGLYRIAGDQARRIEVSHSDVTCLQSDPDGNIWVGTNGGGLVRLKTKTFWLYDKSSGLTDDFSHSVSADADGVIWLANRDGGVACIRNGVVDPISKRAAWRTFSAKSVFPAHDRSVWIATGIGVYRTQPDQPERVYRVPSLANTKSVRVTFVARNGDYWLAVDPDKILRWRAGAVTTYGIEHGFDGREIRAIAEDPDGRIWIGAADGRLFRSKGEDFERVPLPAFDDYGLFQAIWFEPNGTILVGTTRKGVLILPKDGASRLLSTKHGLPNGDVSSILQDDAGRFWFASRGGIFSIQAAQVNDFSQGKIDRVHAVLVGKDYGMPQLSVLGRTQPSACKARDGSLWFATRKGVVRVDPSLAPEIAGPGPAKIARIECDNEAQSITPNLRIRSTVRKTEIRFSVLSLSIPEQTVLRYRLEGFDSDWIQPGTLRTVAYPKLSPGSYTLYAEVSDGAETWMPQPPLLTITVMPPWWQSWWAQVAYVTTLMLAVAVLARVWGHRRLKQRLAHVQQEQRVEHERMRIARNIHDDLGATLTRIGLITESTAHKHPELASELEQISETVRNSTRSLDETVWAVNPKWDDVENLVSYLGNFTQKFLGSAGIRRHLNLPTIVPSLKLPSQVRHHLFLCCKEALNNIAKHASAKEVVMTITATEALLSIEISDNGRGLSAEAAPTPENDPRIATGSGIQNMRERMDEIGGGFEIFERAGGGTTVIFRLTFPLKSIEQHDAATTTPPFLTS